MSSQLETGTRLLLSRHICKWDRWICLVKWTNTSGRDIPLVLFAYGGYKLIRGTKIIPLESVPLRQAIEEADNDPDNVPIPKGSRWSKFNILWG